MEEQYIIPPVTFTPEEEQMLSDWTNRTIAMLKKKHKVFNNEVTTQITTLK